MSNKDNKEEYNAHFYIVDSVKGGCGKTSLAVWKAIDIATKAKEEQEALKKAKEALKEALEEKKIINAIEALETDVIKVKEALKALNIISENNVKEELTGEIKSTTEALTESLTNATKALEEIAAIETPQEPNINKAKETLEKSIELAKDVLESIKVRPRSVCYIDLDLLGTSIEKMLGFNNATQYWYLNDLFSGDRAAVQKKRVKRDFKLITIKAENNSGYRFDNTEDHRPDAVTSIGMVFSSPEQKEKNKFRVGHSTDGHHIDFDFFARRLNELFNELIDGGVTDFVIDMPPNSDPYTDSIFGQFLKREIKRRKIGVHLLLISSLDRAHLEANRQWLIDLCSKSAQWYEFTSVAYYFNDIRNNLKNKRSDEKVNDVKLLAGKIVRDMKDVCNCKEQQSYLIEHNTYLSDFAIWQGGNPDQETTFHSTFPSISTIPVNFEE